ncbi:MAG: HypC/HybG/HupF family hydrogenase formation chaperone [Thermodesulfobacteriota bacterium]
MCLARPVQVLDCDGEWVKVNDGHGRRRRVYAALLSSKDLKAGDYIFVHGELAVHKVPEDEALKIIALTESWAPQ